MSEPNLTVVVIEDDKQIRRFVRSTLEAQGMTVFEAETGQQGLREAAFRLPDLIVIDLGLPDTDGIDVIRHSTAHLLAQAVKELFPEAQVTIGPVIEDGFYYDFAYKRPFTTEDLVAIEAKGKRLPIEADGRCGLLRDRGGLRRGTKQSESPDMKDRIRSLIHAVGTMGNHDYCRALRMAGGREFGAGFGEFRERGECGLSKGIAGELCL